MATWSSSPYVPHTDDGTFNFPPNHHCDDISYKITYTDDDGCSKTTYFYVEGQAFSCDNVTGTFIQLNNGAYDDVKIGEVFFDTECAYIDDYYNDITADEDWIWGLYAQDNENGDGIDVYATVACNPLIEDRPNTIRIPFIPYGEGETCIKTFEITQQASSEITGTFSQLDNGGYEDVKIGEISFNCATIDEITADEDWIGGLYAQDNGDGADIYGYVYCNPFNIERLNTIRFSFNGGSYTKPFEIRQSAGSSQSGDYVEIGGVKWATKNIGANSITDYGLYFGWADKNGYTAAQVGVDKTFGWSSYVWGDGGSMSMTKYNNSDGLTTVEPSDDAAHVILGDKWRMPTKDEFVALGNAVTTAWTSDYQGSGVAGLICRNKFGECKELFFPANGYGGADSGVGPVNTNIDCNYWSSTRASWNSNAYYLVCTANSTSPEWNHTSYRPTGRAIRPVYDDSLIIENIAKLTLDNGNVINIEGSGELTESMVADYKETTVKAEITPLCTSIGSSAFYGCSGLTSCTIGNGVTSIGSDAFRNCGSLPSIVIPNSVTSIGNSAFQECGYLTGCTMGSGVTSIGNLAFYNCSSLTSVNIPSGVTSIGNFTFNGCTSLPNIVIPNSATSIGNYAFSLCISLTSVRIPNSVTSIGQGAFSQCSGLTSVNIPSGVTSIDNFTFNRCTSLPNIIIPNSVTSIGYAAFAGCGNMTTCTIGSGVTSIGESAFYQCSSLTSVTIPSGVTSIGASAFTHSVSLTSITVEATTPATLDIMAFDNTNNCPIYVPCESVDAYKAATNWSTYANRITSLCVDLGLPSGTLWAKYNVGATTETEYGNYYQYGKGAAQYSATSGKSDYSGTEDPLSTSVDTARQVMGAGWHMPTSAQWQELIDQCTWTWTTSGGTNGYSASKNGKSIFFPAAGYFYRGTQRSVGNGCFYWSSSPSDGYGNQVYYFRLDNGYIDILSNYRVYGYLVRGVIG